MMRTVSAKEGNPQRVHADENTSVRELLAHHRAWNTFADGAILMIPALKAQMTAVTAETERAAVELLVQLQALASGAETMTPAARTEIISKVVIAMQFQDITRQKLEHVGLALDQFKRHLQVLQEGPLTEETAQELAGLERIEQNYTMEAERRLHQAALQPQYQEPVPVEASDNGDDAVTLF
jgi:hypothetical protein